MLLLFTSPHSKQCIQDNKTRVGKVLPKEATYLLNLLLKPIKYLGSKSTYFPTDLLRTHVIRALPNGLAQKARAVALSDYK
jgi:hypothetical protein